MNRLETESPSMHLRTTTTSGGSSHIGPGVRATAVGQSNGPLGVITVRYVKFAY